MTNVYIPNEQDKKRYEEEIRRTAELLNKKPARQGSNQDIEKVKKGK